MSWLDLDPNWRSPPTRVFFAPLLCPSAPPRLACRAIAVAAAAANTAPSWKTIMPASCACNVESAGAAAAASTEDAAPVVLDTHAGFDNTNPFAKNRACGPSHISQIHEQQEPAPLLNLRKTSGASLHADIHTEPFPETPQVASRHSKSFGHDSPRSSITPHTRPTFISHQRSFEGRRPDSPASTSSSPIPATLSDITPLPSPTFAHNWSSEPLKKLSIPQRSTLSSNDSTMLSTPCHVNTPPPRRKKTYPGLGLSPVALERPDVSMPAEDRVLSEFVPNHLQNSRLRITSVPIDALLVQSDHSDAPESLLHREHHLVRQRKLLAPEAVDSATTLPTPPLSEKESDEVDQNAEKLQHEVLAIPSGPEAETRLWRPVRRIGQGAFSEVVLAARQDKPSDVSSNDEPNVLVAVKIVNHERDASIDNDRMETSIRREIEIMRSVSHPSLMRLDAFAEDGTRALLVMKYCPGGDLFDLASQQSDVLVPELVQRIFAELVSATLHLHNQWIVHRDIKLENILLNIPSTSLLSLPRPLCNYSEPLITLTDFGLSRHVPQLPESPLLSHRCGSADYAAPEVLLGQPYDGRETDAWALGVTLYALLEGRLPFDPPPPRPGRRRTGGNTNVKHRIARCDWVWVEYGDNDGEWAGAKTAKCREFEGARAIVEGLLKKVGRGRWELKKVAHEQWVKEGLCVARQPL